MRGTKIRSRKASQLIFVLLLFYLKPLQQQKKSIILMVVEDREKGKPAIPLFFICKLTADIDFFFCFRKWSHIIIIDCFITIARWRGSRKKNDGNLWAVRQALDWLALVKNKLRKEKETPISKAATVRKFSQSLNARNSFLPISSIGVLCIRWENPASTIPHFV